MTPDENAAKMRVALQAAKGRLDRAEEALAGVLRVIAARALELRTCAEQLAETPALDGDDPAFAAFADRRRAALRARAVALTDALKNLYTDEKSRRADVERMLRQKISLEEAAAKAEAARARKRPAGAISTGRPAS